VPLRVLLVEDSQEDVLLILAELRRGGFDPIHARVDTAEDLRRALDEAAWDLVIADYRMPGFSGLAALRLLRGRGLDVPFILASAVVGEDTAVEAMRAGANDYVMKSNLARLPVAIERELREAEVRRERRRVEEALKRQLLFTRALSGSLGEGVCAVDRAGHLTFANPAAEHMLGFRAPELLGRELHDIIQQDGDEVSPRGERCCAILDVMRACVPYHSDDVWLRRKDASAVPVSLTAAPLRTDDEVDGAVVAFQDVSERKRAERAERFLSRASRALAEELEYEPTLERVASLYVGELAEVALLLVSAEVDGACELVVAAAPGLDGLVEVGRRGVCLLDAAADEPGPARVLRTRRADRAPLAPSWLVALAAASRSAAFALTARGSWWCASIPLASRGEVFGAVALLADATRPPLDDADLGLAQDLADRAALAIESARLYRAAREAIRARDDFVSVAAHELRGPIAPLKLQARALLDGARRRELDRSAHTVADLQRLTRQVDRLDRLVRNLLDVSLIAAGAIQLEREELDLAALAREVVERAEVEAQRAGSTITLRAEERVVGRWDRLRVEQIVTNLVSNAIKYGRGGPITISVERRGRSAWLAVRDRGIGIPPEQRERIFERFGRVAAAPAYRSMGLGLYIVRQLVEAHGGQVHLESELHVGSTFAVELRIE
jgi:PAS domain S-box-containing protein